MWNFLKTGFSNICYEVEKKTFKNTRTVFQWEIFRLKKQNKNLFIVFLKFLIHLKCTNIFITINRCIGSIHGSISYGTLSYFPALHLWVDLASPADFAREPSTVISSELHSWVDIAICWSFAPTVASRWVSPTDVDYLNAECSVPKRVLSNYQVWLRWMCSALCNCLSVVCNFASMQLSGRCDAWC